MNDNRIKQVIILRTDLNMRKGKMVSSGCHASMAALLNSGTQEYDPCHCELRYDFTSLETVLWLQGKFTKITVKVDSLEELLELHEKVKLTKLPYALITDAGDTEFKGVPTVTCLGIGPAYSDEIDEITGHLKLL